MSFEDRFRSALADVMTEVRTRLETEFEGTLADVRTAAERDKDAALAAADEASATALAAARAEAQTALQQAFEAEKAALVSNHERLLAEAADAARLEVTRLTESAAADLARARAEAEATVDAVRAELREAQAAALRHREHTDSSVTRVQDDHTAALALLASARAEAQEAAALHSQAVDAHQAGALRLLESIRELDTAASLTEVLDALTTGAAREAGRAAMLVVKGDRLVGWRTLGFGSYDQEPRTLESSTADVGALAAAVNTGRPAVVGAGSVLTAPAFSQAPADRPGLAVPLLVAGKPVAVVYADPGTVTPVSGWTSPVEVLVRHAARCLEGLAVQRAAARPAAARVSVPA